MTLKLLIYKDSMNFIMGKYYGEQNFGKKYYAKKTTSWLCAESTVLSDQFPKYSTRLLF